MKEIAVTFWAGVLTFFSPCVLPLIPGYLSMISGFSAVEIIKGENANLHKKVVVSTLFFFLGFAAVFSALGAAASFLGKFLLEHRDLFQKIMGIAMILLGAHLGGFINLNFLNYEKRAIKKSAQKNLFTAFVMGASFAFGWSPCIGPVLASVLMLASSASVYKGMLMLFVYSIGLGIPFLVAGLFGASFFKIISSKKHIFVYVEKIAAVALIILGILLFINKFSVE